MKVPQLPKAARLDALDERFVRLLGLYVNERRCMLHMSQQELAAATGLSRTEIHKIEHGQTSEKITTVMRVSGGLKVGFVEMVAHLDFLMAHPECEPQRCTLKTGRGAKS